MDGMVTIDGIRYCKEDAEKRGLSVKAVKPEAKARQAPNKAVKPADK